MLEPETLAAAEAVLQRLLAEQAKQAQLLPAKLLCARPAPYKPSEAPVLPAAPRPVQLPPPPHAHSSRPPVAASKPVPSSLPAPAPAPAPVPLPASLLQQRLPPPPPPQTYAQGLAHLPAWPPQSQTQPALTQLRAPRPVPVSLPADSLHSAQHTAPHTLAQHQPWPSAAQPAAQHAALAAPSRHQPRSRPQPAFSLRPAPSEPQHSYLQPDLPQWLPKPTFQVPARPQLRADACCCCEPTCCCTAD